MVDFPAATNRIRVSLSGGRGPVWHPRAGELFFLTLDGKSLMSARQRTDGEGYEEPRKLFDVPGTVWTGTTDIPPMMWRPTTSVSSCSDAQMRLRPPMLRSDPTRRWC